MQNSVAGRKFTRVYRPANQNNSFSGGNLVDDGKLNSLERAFRKSYDTEGWRKSVCFPESARVLRAMHERGYRLFVVSNKPRHVSLQILDRQGILKFFELILTRDSRSPEYQGKEEMVRALMAERLIAGEDCMMVGDTAEDASAAEQAGIKFIWMTHGYGGKASISASSALDKFDSFSQFLPLIDQGAFCD